MIDDFARDLAHGLRLLRRTPAFTAVVTLTLGIAIGATVTVFSIVDAWLLKPLNFPEPDRLVTVFAAQPERPTEPAVFLPYRAYLAWKERNTSFASISAAFMRDVTLTTGTEARTLLGMSVSPEFFRTFGVTALLGRTLSEDDANGPGAIVLSYGLWQRQFGGASDAIGKSIVLSGAPHHVVGVMPRDFETRLLDMRFEFWTPFRPGQPGYGAGGAGPVAVIGRMQNGATLERARGELATIARDTESAYPRNFNRFVINVTSLQADNARAVRVTLVTVSAAVVSVLLMAALNVGTLLLGRGLARMREAAIRAAMGSGRSRLIRQFLTESLVVAVLGGVVGLALATIAIRLFVSWSPLGALPATPIQLDLRMLAVGGAAMALTTVVCGLLPALRMSTADPQEALRGGGERGSAGAPAQRAQAAMLMAQMAACVVLLFASTLLVRTLVRLQAEPMGFDPANLAVANVILPNDPFGSSELRNQYVDQLAERLRSMAAVTAVAAGTAQPLNSGAPATVNVGADDAVDAPRISAQEVTSGFFDALDIPVIAGRPFTDADRAGGAAVAIVNARAAQQLFGSAAAALGQRVRLDKEPWREIVGVVGNVRSAFFNTLAWKTDPIVYRPAAQGFSTLSNPTATSFGFKLHLRADRPLTIADIRTAASAVNPRAAVTEFRAVTEMTREATSQPAFRTRLLLGFGAVSLLLAGIGIYGLVAQAVAQRRRELAIRMALGAQPRAVVAGVTRGAMLVAASGLGIGIVASILLANLLQALLFGVRPQDITSFVTAGLMLFGVTAVAAIVPARRAVRIDPATALRAD